MDQVESLCTVFRDETRVCSAIAAILRDEQEAVIRLRPGAILACLEQRQALQDELLRLVAQRRALVRDVARERGAATESATALLPLLPPEPQARLRAEVALAPARAPRGARPRAAERGPRRGGARQRGRSPARAPDARARGPLRRRRAGGGADDDGARRPAGLMAIWPPCQPERGADEPPQVPARVPGGRAARERLEPGARRAPEPHLTWRSPGSATHRTSPSSWRGRTSWRSRPGDSQEQLASGRRLIDPEDDPLGAGGPRASTRAWRRSTSTRRRAASGSTCSPPRTRHWATPSRSWCAPRRSRRRWRPAS